MSVEGILLVDKPVNKSSFACVAAARRRLGVKKIGHGGTLDPFATGLIVLLVGRNYTKRAGEFLEGNKEYQATALLGVATDSYDCDGVEQARSELIPTLTEVEAVLSRFQGAIEQIPPMFSAKKIAGTRLYELARKGITVERKASLVHVTCRIIRYSYPELEFHVTCSKGTYIRSLAHDIGIALGSYAHLTKLRRLSSGPFSLSNAIDFASLQDPNFPILGFLRDLT